LTGQEATSGGTSLGLGNGEIFADIKQSFIDENAECLAETIHRDGLTPVAEKRGLPGPWATWNTTPPADQKLMAEAAKSAGEGLTALSAGLIAIEPDATKRPVIDVRSYLEKLNIALVEQDELEEENVVNINGLKILIEWPEGSIRTGVASDGTKWATLMVGASYGEIVGTEGEDGDRIDAYVGPYTYVPNAYLLEQLREDGERDEFKIFLGFSSLEHAQATFRRLGRADLEGQWTELPVSMLRGMISGDESNAPGTMEQGAATIDPNAPAVAGSEAQLFAYYLTSDVVSMNEARGLAGQPRDERMGDMYPSEWAAQLRAEAAKATGADPGAATQTLGENGIADTGAAALTNTLDNAPSIVAHTDPIAVAAEDDSVDIPTDAEAVRLADELTLHKIARCEHGRVNECPKCGVERVRGVLVDEAGAPVLDENGDPKWKIAWRAIDSQKVAAEAPKKYSHIDFTPSKGAREEAQRGLDWRKEHGRGGTEVGVAHGRDLSNGVQLSPETVRRMKAFFDRHENSAGKGSKPGEDGFPSPWVIAWKLWGGDAGYAWAKKVVRQMESADDDE
jgi:hypothetical protein